MASANLISIIRKVDSNFYVLYKIFNITENKSQLLQNIIEYSNIKKSKCDNYLAIFIFELLLYMVVVDM